MRTVGIEVFEFSELSKKAQTKAVDNFRIGYPCEGWQDDIRADWVKKLELLGYPEPEIDASVSYCRGDGARFFTSKVKAVDVKEIAARHPRAKEILEVTLNGIEDFGIRIVPHGYSRYSHDMTMYAETDCREDLTSEQELAMNELEEIVLQDARELAEQLYQDLRDESDRLYEEDHIISCIEDDELEFTADGEVFRE